MPRPRLFIAVGLMLAAFAFALAVPAGALAGGSAGNQQYTDPFGGSGTTQATTSAGDTGTATTSPTTATAPPPTPTTATGAPAPAATVTAGDPATVASATSTTTSTLPVTGFADWAAGALGAGLLAAGVTLRLRTRED